MFKEHTVVMLPTNEKAENCFIERFGRLSFKKDLFTQEYLQYNQAKAFHLYILSDEEIKEGLDVVYNNKIYSTVYSNTTPHGEILLSGYGYVMKSDCKKIIACTDSSLEIVSKGINPVYEKLPQPSPSFIQKFVEEYNKGNVITEVIVEYEDLTEQLQESVDNLRECCLEDFDNEEESPYYNLLEQAIVELSNYVPNIKINPKDNTITIKKVKDSWSREEVVNLLKESYKQARTAYSELDRIGLDKWIEQNL